MITILEVSKEDILCLRSLNYSWTKIASLLGISRRTLYRHLEEFNIPCSDFTQLTSNEIDDVIKDIKIDHPNDGEVMIKGHLSSCGIRVPRADLRASIHRIDHNNTVSRRSDVVKRRVYAVTRPNAMWHIDGNHKLIRWRLVVHAGVDGFSRTLVFIKGAGNNCAPTVLSAFLEGVAKFGLPEHVRSDHGGENIDVWRHMIEENNSCITTGCSTHNERVERMWRDVYRCVSSEFAATFHALESEGYLDPLNEVDIFCLHHIPTTPEQKLARVSRWLEFS